MERRKAIGILVILAIMIAAIGIGSLRLFPDTEDDMEEVEEFKITPHPFNYLNWWDIPGELGNLALILTPLTNLYSIGPRYGDSDGYYLAAEYVLGTLESLDLEAGYWGLHDSVVGYQQGYGNDSRAIVFGAHLDSGPSSYGIDQNGGGVAVVLAIASILNHYRLPIDVYYAFYQANMEFLDDEQKVRAMWGSKEASQKLLNDGVKVIAAYNFDELLYMRNDLPKSERLLVEHDVLTEAGYHNSKYLADLLVMFMNNFKMDIISTLQNTRTQTDHWAYWQRGIPAVNVRSGHDINPDLPYQDRVHFNMFNKTQALYVARAAASIAVFLGMSGNGEPTYQKHNVTIPSLSTSTMRLTLSKEQTLTFYGSSSPISYFKVQASQAGNTLIEPTVFSGGSFTLTTNQSAGLGPLTVTIQNLGNASEFIDLRVDLHQDTDGNGIADADQYSWPDPDPPLDWDNDGLSDEEERIIGTDIFVADTDGDGWNDGIEVANGLDPLRDDMDEDLDGDGLTNREELELGTNPACNDTDGDGMPDGWEVKWGTNPLVDDADEDPDGDGLTNYEEYLYGSDPFSPDGDSDGVSDVEEIARGMDPLNPDSDGDGLNDFLELLEGLNPLHPDYDGDFLFDGHDPNPRVNQIVVFGLMAGIPIIIGTVVMRRRIKRQNN